ncbi:TPA: cold shock domain-containing protein, partial [Vibrio parahaemolyticus]|nr:cold shock domain-containing protein [Vibrio parahaemolyticus]
MKGIIVRWVDDRGFGFINSEELDGDIFVHVS